VWGWANLAEPIEPDKVLCREQGVVNEVWLPRLVIAAHEAGNL
jgi:hypothetical protein